MGPGAGDLQVGLAAVEANVIYICTAKEFRAVPVEEACWGLAVWGTCSQCWGSCTDYEHPHPSGTT